eukprot:scaffold74564_cov22-Tisochrysis_lutea.AAC.3
MPCECTVFRSSSGFSQLRERSTGVNCDLTARKPHMSCAPIALAVMTDREAFPPPKPHTMARMGSRVCPIARISRVESTPFITGIIMSMSTTSNWRPERMAATASTPLLATCVRAS